MDRSVEMLVLMASLATLGLAGWAAYRWACRRRARLVRGWVRDYLACRRGGLAPGGLAIGCTDDRLWPVLVSFDDPAGGPPTRLRFSCAGGRDTLRLVEHDLASGPAESRP